MSKDIQHRRRLNLEVGSKEDWGAVIDAVEALGMKDAMLRLTGSEEPSVKEFYDKDETKDGMVINHFSRRLKTVEDLVDYHEIDTSNWEQHRLKTNYWEVGMKLKRPDGSLLPIVEPLHQITVEWRRMSAPSISKETVLSWIQEAHEAFPDVRYEPMGWATKTDCALEIMIPDLHIGAIGIDDPWSFERIKEVWFKALYTFLAKAGRIDTVIIPIGNDFMHIDNIAGTTTRGTQMEYQSNWFKCLIFAGELIADTIAAIPSEIEIIMPFVYGNHDTHSTLSLHEIVRNRFKGDPNVSFPTPNLNGRQYVQFGDNLLAYMHGDSIKNTTVQAVVSTECPFWSDCKYRFVRVGHLHKREKKVWTMTTVTDEICGLEIETCPSLKPTDLWHDKNSFIGNMRRATAFIHHKEQGMIHQLFHNL